MRVTEIRVSFGRTLVPPGGDRYQPIKLDASVTMSVDEGEDPAAVKTAAQVELRKLLEETYRAQHKATKEPEPTRQSSQQPGSFKPAEPEF